MSKELVERLRKLADDQIEDEVGYIQDADAAMYEAADLIDQQSKRERELLGKLAIAESIIERQKKIIEHLVELFVDTTTVENPEQERVVIEARSLTNTGER